MGRRLGAQQQQAMSTAKSTSLSSFKRNILPPRNITLPIIVVDDTFSAEDASYSVSASEDEEERVKTKDTAAADEQKEQVEVELDEETPDDSTRGSQANRGENTTNLEDSSERIVEDDNLEEVQAGDDRSKDDDNDESTVFQLLDLMGSNATDLVYKRNIFSLLLDAGIDSLDFATIRQLPDWKQVSALYYSSNRRPVIHGLDTCDMYRQSVPVDQRYVATAGMFNTGTNALSFLLAQNIMTEIKPQWQVPWSKHRLLRISANHTAPNMEQFNRKNVLPIVIVKDIYTWLQSMCRSPYEARWKHGAGHCPNLIPNEYDLKRFTMLKDHKTVPVKVQFSETQAVYWGSLVSMYNDWYREYTEADFPRLMVRFEDLLFAPEDLLQAVADCVGAELRSSIVYKTESSKQHGSQTTLIGAIIKTGTGRDRLSNMTQADLDYVDRTVDEELLTAFDYTRSHVQLSLQSEDQTQQQ